MHPSWRRALEPVRAELELVSARVQEERSAGVEVLPPAELELRAFEQPLDDVRVLILGQDPYPTPGHPVGLAFAVEPHVRPLPPSLRNILTELHEDLGDPVPANPDLSRWAQAGVLLLNRTLTVRAGTAGSHATIGWEPVTRAAVHALASRGGPLVAVLWGAHAQQLRGTLADTPAIVSPHPSPLSAYRGFFGSRPFSRANELLRAQGAEPIDWSLE
ncbi:MAG: uracil-DNA glycosylase [Agromyces sp.]